jgi:hypothetical protein
VEEHSTTGQATSDNKAHAHFILDDYGYTHTHTKCNIYCFSTDTMVAQTRLTVTLYLHLLSCHTVTLAVQSQRQTAPQIRYNT